MGNHDWEEGPPPRRAPASPSIDHALYGSLGHAIDEGIGRINAGFGDPPSAPEESGGDAPIPIEHEANLIGTNRKTIRPRKVKSKDCKVENALRHIEIPNNIKGVLKHEFREEFLDACESELSSHDANSTWTLVARKPGMKVIGSTWSFDIKRDTDKSILRFKARLCAQGFGQIKGIDYHRKYSHTVPLDILRLLISICAERGLELTEADYTTAYLNAGVDTEIYMSQSPGFAAVDDHGNELRGENGEELVCMLGKAIYGLIQSGLLWEEEHHDALKDLTWEQCGGEPCLFRKKIKGVWCYLCTYFDNLFMAFPPGSTHREHELEVIRKRYDIKDLSRVSYSLGVRVRKNPHVPRLSPLIRNPTSMV